MTTPLNENFFFDEEKKTVREGKITNKKHTDLFDETREENVKEREREFQSTEEKPAVTMWRKIVHTRTEGEISDDNK